jgi:hypothetical protein
MDPGIPVDNRALTRRVHAMTDTGGERVPMTRRMTLPAAVRCRELRYRYGAEALMPGWVKAISYVNPLSYEVEALRGLLIGVPARPPLDFAVLAGAAALAIAVSSAILDRLVR